MFLFGCVARVFVCVLREERHRGLSWSEAPPNARALLPGHKELDDDSLDVVEQVLAPLVDRGAQHALHIGRHLFFFARAVCFKT
jgi:hypothetical protein